VIAGRFEVTGMLGGGGMAMVYRAIDREYDRSAAVKIMNAGLAGTPEFRERFAREAHVAQHAVHQNILPIWASGEDEGLFYIVTPLADSDLGQLIDDDGMPPLEAAEIMRQVARALDAAAQRGVVHRDVKPENVLIIDSDDPSDPEQHVYLADFGIAKAAGGVTLTSAQMPLSVQYASPEQIRGERTLGPASDQYSLACTFYDALVGRPPFADHDTQQGILEAHLSERPPALSELRPGLPVELDAVFARALAKEPGDRYESCRAFVAAARAALSAAAITDVTPPEPDVSEPQDDTVIPDVVAVPPDEGDKTVIDPPVGDDKTVIDPPVGDDKTVIDPPRRDDDGGSKRRRRRVLVGGGLLAAVVAIAAGAAFALGGGDGGEELTAKQLPGLLSKDFKGHCESITAADLADANKTLAKVNGSKISAAFGCDGIVDDDDKNLVFALSDEPAKAADGLMKADTAENDGKRVPCKTTVPDGTLTCVVGDAASVVYVPSHYSNVFVFATAEYDEQLHTEDDQKLRDAVAAVKRYGLLTAETRANSPLDDPARLADWKRPFGRDDDAEAEVDETIPDIDELTCDPITRGGANGQGVPEDVGAVRVCGHTGIDDEVGEDAAAAVRVFQFSSADALDDRFRDYIKYGSFDGEDTVARADCDRDWEGGYWTFGGERAGRIRCIQTADYRATVWTDPARKLIVVLQLYPLDVSLPSDQQMFKWWAKLAGQLHRRAA
jgi:serine/threonine-protein kinase